MLQVFRDDATFQKSSNLVNWRCHRALCRFLKVEADARVAGAPAQADPWAAGRAAAAAATPAQTKEPAGQGGPFGGQSGQGAQHFNLSTPVRAPRAVYNPNWRYDNKLSTDVKFQYDPKDTKAWLAKVKNYFIGQCPDAELLLDHAEKKGNDELSQIEVKGLQQSLCLDADPVQVSQAIWSWLQMPLMGSGIPETDLNNAEKPNGLEVWRCLAVPSVPRSHAIFFVFLIILACSLFSHAQCVLTYYQRVGEPPPGAKAVAKTEGAQSTG